MQMES